MIKDNIINNIKNALRKFIKNDLHLLKVNSSERSITHRLAIYIQEEFPDWHVDCEYNRNDFENKIIDNENKDKIKRLEKFSRKFDPNGKKGTNVFPDIIVHQRGTNNNFIVIEAKKKEIINESIAEDNCNGNIRKCACDKCKLMYYLKDEKLLYKHAFFIIFPIKDATLDISIDRMIYPIINCK